MVLVSGENLGEVRKILAGNGIKFRQCAIDGGLMVDPWEDFSSFAEPANWSAAARRLVQNRKQITDAVDGVRAEFDRIRGADVATAYATIADGALTGQLDDHQAVNVALLTAPGTWGGCVFDEQGTGKTVTMIATFDLLVERGLTDTLLVVAPKSMIAEWHTEFGRFAGDLYRVVVAEGDRHTKAAALYDGADVIVVNFETLVAMESDVIQLARRTRLTIAVDESFNVKNPDAGRTQVAQRVRDWCSHAFVLCGTPAPNAAADVIAQFDLVDLGYTFRGLRLDADRTIAARQVSDRLAERGLYVRNVKTVALPNLPPRSFTEIAVELAPRQRAAYDAALQNLVVDLQHADDRAFAKEIQSFLERRAALLRICADPTPLVPGYDETPAKIAALDELLEHLVAGGEKVVVWSFYRASLERLALRYGHLGLVRIDGTITDSGARRRAVRAFQEDPNIRIFLGNPAAAGAGLTLHSARYAVYESLSNQAAHYLQSLDRIHRRGQRRDVRYITLVARDTVEEIEYARLRAKAEEQANLLGDPPSPAMTRTMLLEELLSVRRDLMPVRCQ
ncbi:DEAD/DEAH box helicase [Mycobacteroides abscessus]|nr:hypothetical protein DDJ88_08225 [Mycobacteroides abscessus]PVA52362.1 hypothetical protein DDJ35_01715 [Mycobacteroides abscessus]RIQ86557.1 DEAD/DEAH box helicase [Mycobacteroides abscessus]RIQ96559.1 DEAD/DEAH box helicase [Mycobacteroides abscessus]RIS06343.1 DEAD/DEAH box helicase [Mycobacteroides abscessus]